MVDEDKNISIDDRIARYLRGEMPQDEANEFLHDLKNREDMKDVLEQALATAYLAKAVKEVGEQQGAGIIAALEGIDTEAATEVANNASAKRKASAHGFWKFCNIRSGTLMQSAPNPARKNCSLRSGTSSGALKRS